jgi:hypothetical protein
VFGKGIKRVIAQIKEIDIIQREVVVVAIGIAVEMRLHKHFG